MEKIVKEIEFELRGQVVKGKFPTIGQQISVETTKQVLSEGRYALMAYSGLATSAEVLDYIDAIAYMTNCVEGFYDTIPVKSTTALLDLDRDSQIIKDVVDAYVKHYQPFFNKLYLRDDRPLSDIKAESEETTEVAESK